MSELTTKEALLERAVAALEKIKTVIGEINPAGVIQAFAGSTTPDGWLLCDGSAVSRTTYSDLFAAIGTTYGAGDESTTFNLPNLIDRFVEGSATAGTEKSAGLPNITGTLRPDGTDGGSDMNIVGTGAITGYNTVRPTNSAPGISDWNSGCGFDFDANKSNSIYGNSTTVQPPALTMRYIIKY